MNLFKGKKKLVFYSVAHKKKFSTNDYKIVKKANGGHAAIANYKGSKVYRFI